jgi:hypothetical protein
VATWLVARTAEQPASAYMVMAAALSFLSMRSFRAGSARLEAVTSPAPG